MDRKRRRAAWSFRFDFRTVFRCVIARMYYLLLDVGNGQLTKPSGVVAQRVIREATNKQTN
jgi:hypothetical protein